MKELRPHQKEKSCEAAEKLDRLGLVYLACEVRTGKTCMSLNVAKLVGAKDVLFLTKKRGISSIEEDYVDFGFDEHFKLSVINDESMHKLDGNYDLIIHDEHHRFGAFPLPNKAAKDFKKRWGHLPQIYLSGTPHAESFSQIYHQFWVSKFTPFHQWDNFYRWAKEFVTVITEYHGHGPKLNYSDADYDRLEPMITPYMVTLTQEVAGFTTEIDERVLTVTMNPKIDKYIKMLRRDRVVVGQEETILADTGAKLMSKIHQLSSGTVIFESGNTKILDTSKADYIKERFSHKKIGIFYKFRAEWDLIKQVFGDTVTQDLDEFNTTDKNIALQIVTGREAISLKEADFLVYFNIDYSAVSYWQSRDRMTTMERKNNTVYWVFSDTGVESNVYKTVQDKKDYTIKVFKKDYRVKDVPPGVKRLATKLKLVKEGL